MSTIDWHKVLSGPIEVLEWEPDGSIEICELCTQEREVKMIITAYEDDGSMDRWPLCGYCTEGLLQLSDGPVAQR